jgi:phosphoribosylaminoimidazole-succinocarboxamide synthase
MTMKPKPGLTETSYPELGVYYRGKVRDNYISGDRRYLVATDRISAFDRVFTEPVPHKGRILTELSVYFIELARRIVPCAYLESPHPNVMVARQCEVFPVEMVVRGYLAGSAWAAYERGERTICGVKLPEGLKKNAQLDQPILTPTTKAEEGHDEPISREEILQSHLVPKSAYLEMERMSLELFEQGTAHARERGLILVDTKYEFGADAEGAPVLVDEVHTPDSSRYFRLESYEKDPSRPEQLSKEFLREWLRERGFTGAEGQPIPALPDEILSGVTERYAELFQTLTGRTPHLTESSDLHKEIYDALKAAGHLRGHVAVVVAGSRSDEPNVEKLMDELVALGVPCVSRIVSAHRDPWRMLELIAWVDRSPGDVVWVDVTGLSNAKGPLLGASTANPVIHCVFEPTSPDLLASVNLPSGVPLAVVARPKNAALCVAKTLGLKHPAVRRKVEESLAAGRRESLRADRARSSARRPA